MTSSLGKELEEIRVTEHFGQFRSEIEELRRAARNTQYMEKAEVDKQLRDSTLNVYFNTSWAPGTDYESETSKYNQLKTLGNVEKGRTVRLQTEQCPKGMTAVKNDQDADLSFPLVITNSGKTCVKQGDGTLEKGPSRGSMDDLQRYLLNLPPEQREQEMRRLSGTEYHPGSY
jgi:hypothetical protein